MSISQNFPNVAGNFNVNFAEAKTLDSRITFTRSQTSPTGSTYVGADGLIKYAASNQPRFDHQATERTNLFTYSEDFSNVAWQKSSSTITSNVTATTAPDGTTTADKLVENSGAGNKEVLQSFATVTNGVNYTISIFAKAAERTLFRLAMDTTRFSAQTNAYFNLSTGVVPLTEGGVISASITPVGDGWFRCSATMRPTSTGNSSVYITLVESGITSNYTGNGSSGIYIWGAQFEIGAAVSNYIPTIASAISRSTIESLGLLIEEQRSNILRYSEDFSQTGVNNWDIGQPTNTRSSNATLAPDGNTTADKLIEGTSSAAGFTFYQPNTVSGSGNVCFSCFLKASERRYAQLDVWDGNTIAANALFDLQTGSYLSSGFTGGGSISVVSYGITSYPNGWYRCHLVVNRSSITYLYSRISICATNPISAYTGTGTSGIFVWGAQLEVGQAASSYIPTTSSSVTRSQDFARITGAAFTSIYNQNEGTIRAEGVFNDPISNPVRYGGVFAAGNGTSGHNGIFYNPQPAYGYYCSNDQQTPAIQLEATGNYSLGVPYKIACSYNSNEQFSAVKNGGTVQSSTQLGALLRSHLYFQIGGSAINQNTQGLQTISSISYYSRKLTDSQMQTLTR